MALAPQGLEDVVVEVSTPLHPTEDGGAVSAAVLNLFPTLELETGDREVRGRGEGVIALARLRRRLREMRIRDTARSVLLSSCDGGQLTIVLNKQSAFSRVPNFSTGGAPLGDIDVRVLGQDPTAIARWLCELDEP